LTVTLMTTIFDEKRIGTAHYVVKTAKARLPSDVRQSPNIHFVLVAMDLDWSRANNTGLGPTDVLFKGTDALLRAAQGALPIPALVDFIESVNWTEPFIFWLLAGQVTAFATVLMLSRWPFVQALLFTIFAAIIGSAKWLNKYGKEHWIEFARQDYFDSQGLFMLIFVCGPLLFSANAIVVRFDAMHCLVDMRKQQFTFHCSVLTKKKRAYLFDAGKV
jgi:hypothetical protein